MLFLIPSTAQSITFSLYSILYKVGFTLTGNFLYYTGEDRHKPETKISNWSDVPAVILFDWFSINKKVLRDRQTDRQMDRQTDRDRQRERERESVCVCEHVGEHVCVHVSVCVCVCVCARACLHSRWEREQGVCS